ncbi:MAG: glycerophosphodiester phosphodiesterase [Opitutales bacterium]
MAILVIAHRGASAEQPENTLGAFRRALQLGVDGIELDVRVTRDGVPVVCHDASLRRLTGWRRRVDAATWAEIRARRIRGTATIPRLVTVLRLTRGRAVVQIEIKPGVPVGPVVRAVQAARARSGVILASFSLRVLRSARKLAPGLPRMLIDVGSAPPSVLVRRLAAVGAAGLSVNWQAVTSAGLVRHFQRRGFSVWAWTVNRPADMRRLARRGVAALLSDDPALLQRTLRA